MMRSRASLFAGQACAQIDWGERFDDAQGIEHVRRSVDNRLLLHPTRRHTFTASESYQQGEINSLRENSGRVIRQLSAQTRRLLGKSCLSRLVG
jgi:hypothetical protein